MIKTYIKRPVKVQALQYTGDNIKECIDFCGGDSKAFFKENKGLIIVTLEGDHKASVNDFIIRGIHGEHYPCKPDIFKKTYEICNPTSTYLLF